MSVLIKDMEMPKNCEECELYESMYASGCSVASLGIPNRYNYNAKQRPDWCPLVEVKTPHGRLIDADELMNESRKDEAYGYVDTKQIYDAPTVIEEEGEE